MSTPAKESNTSPKNAKQWILEHRGLVEGHMLLHRATWPTLTAHPDATASPVSVFIRVRPLLPLDEKASSFSLLDVQEGRLAHITYPTVTWAGGRVATKTFEANGVFPDSAPNDLIYTGMRLSQELQELLSRKEGELTVLAYGQTGTGKTFTTTSLEEKIALELFDSIDSSSTIQITLSILEIRGNGAYDLLSEPALQPVKIMVTGVSTEYQGLSVHSALEKPELLDLIKRGRELRFTRSTIKNDTSSRSHSIVQIKVVRKVEGVPTNKATINVVDLAGSERASLVTGHDAERHKESVNTNKSLSALKDCIRGRLTPGQRIGWRADKLTMALKGAFDSTLDPSGLPRSRLLVIACVSPSVLDVDDSLNTLKYVTPFQLSAGDAVDATISQTHLGEFDDPRYWNRERTVEYVTRRLPKWARVVDRLLPSPTSTILNLLQLNAETLNILIDTPAENELTRAEVAALSKRDGKVIVPKGRSALPDANALQTATGWTKRYVEKLAELKAKTEEVDGNAKPRKSGIRSRVPSTGSSGTPSRKPSGTAQGAFSSPASASTSTPTSRITAKPTAGVSIPSRQPQQLRKDSALRALNGTDRSAMETGPVQRVQLNGKATPFAAIQDLENATQKMNIGN